MPLPTPHRQLLIVDHPINESSAVNLLGELLPNAPPGTRLTCPARDEGSALFLVTFDSSAEGIVSRFHTLGQLVLLGASVEEVALSPLLSAEVRTLVERLCYRHRLGNIEVSVASILPIVDAAAKLLQLDCVVNHELTRLATPR